MGEFDKEQQVLLHDFENSKDRNERNRISTKLYRLRIDRRMNKDRVMELEDIVKFFEESNHKNTVNKLRQLLGKQRKTEKFLSSERIYKPRKGGTKE